METTVAMDTTNPYQTSPPIPIKDAQPRIISDVKPITAEEVRAQVSAKIAEGRRRKRIHTNFEFASKSHYFNYKNYVKMQFPPPTYTIVEDDDLGHLFIMWKSEEQERLGEGFFYQKDEELSNQQKWKN